MIFNDCDKEIIIEFDRDFTDTPDGELMGHGEYSGELFRKLFLEQQMLYGYKIIIKIGHIYGMPHTFIRGAFRGLSDSIARETSYEPKIRIIVKNEYDNKIANDISEYIEVITI